MKGKMLSIEELLKMDGQYVYIKPLDTRYEEDEGKAKVEIVDDGISFIADNGENWNTFIKNVNSDINANTWLNIYKWIEDNNESQEPKKYRGWEILKMIEDGELEDNNSIIDKSGFATGIKAIKAGMYTSKQLIDKQPFEIRKIPEYLSFDEARKSEKLKYKNWDTYYFLDDVMYKLCNSYNSNTINQMLDEKAWEIK